MHVYGPTWCFSEMCQFLGSGALCLRLETCYEGMIWHGCSYLIHKYKVLLLLCLSDFMACIGRFNIHSEGSKKIKPHLCLLKKL